MATSGSSTWQLTRNEFISAALRKIGVLAKGQTADAEDLLNGQEALNGIMALFQTKGMQLWARDEYTITLVAGQADYIIGVGQAVATPFPLKLHQATLKDTAGGSNLNMNIYSIYQYQELSPTTSSGQPVSVFYQPLINYGKLTVWPTPDTNAAAQKTILLTYQSPLEDFTAAGQTFDFPKEWHKPVIYQLAADLAPEYGVPIMDRDALKKEAAQFIKEAEDFGIEEASLFFQVERP